MTWLSRLAERQIQKARLKGQLQGLQGEGKPLPDRPGDAFISPGDAVGFRIMAEAGVLPEEITLKKLAITTFQGTTLIFSEDEIDIDATVKLLKV